MTYPPRHLAPLPGGADHSAAERGRIDTIRASRALVLLGQMLHYPPARELQKLLLAAGAFMPTPEPSIRVRTEAAA